MKTLNSILFLSAVLTLLVISSQQLQAQWQSPGTLTFEGVNGSTIAPNGDMWVVGDAGFVLKSTDCGATWNVVVVPSGGNDLESIYFQSDSDAFIMSEDGLLLRSVDGGNMWSALGTPATSDLYKMDFASEMIGFCVGRDGNIVKSSNGGTSWTSQISGTAVRLHGVHCFSTINVVVVGRSSTYLTTTNGGSSWTSQATGIPGDIYDITFVSDQVGFIAAEFGAYATSNGGVSWTQLSTPAFAQFNDVHFYDEMNGYWCGMNGLVVATTDGGTTFEIVDISATSELFSIFMQSANVGVVTGDLGTIRYLCEAVEVCFGDFNFDSSINTQDLLLLLTTLGCSESCGMFDLNEDTVVNITDILAFLTVFGTDC